MRAIARTFVAMSKRGRIVIDPEICGGRPIVAGTRMRVVDFLDALAGGATLEENPGGLPLYHA